MDYEIDEGIITRWFALECAECEHKWEEKMQVTTCKFGVVVGGYVCPKCDVAFAGELDEDWRDWEGENY